MYDFVFLNHVTDYFAICVYLNHDNDNNEVDGSNENYNDNDERERERERERETVQVDKERQSVYLAFDNSILYEIAHGFCMIDIKVEVKQIKRD